MNTYIRQRKIKGIFYYWNKQQGRWETSLKQAKPVIEQVKRDIYLADYTEASDIVLVICKRFGCGRHLTLREQLAGDLCIHCAAVKNVDVMNVLKFK